LLFFLLLFLFCFLFLLFCLLFCLISVSCAQCRLCPWNVYFWLSLHTEWHVQSRRYRILSSGMWDIRHLLAISVIYVIGDRIRSKQF
jgi:hypothetical protein